MRVAATTSQGLEFQDFLYAPICQDQEGMTLSVLSALARQDVDPWTEAARLSRLPRKAAVEQITMLLDGLPPRILGCLDRAEVAARLLALLPRNSVSNASGMLQSPATGQRDTAVLAFNWRFFNIYLCLMLLMNWLMAEFRTPPTRPAASATPSAAMTDAAKQSSASSRPEKADPTSDR